MSHEASCFYKVKEKKKLKFIFLNHKNEVVGSKIKLKFIFKFKFEALVFRTSNYKKIVVRQGGKYDYKKRNIKKNNQYA